MTLPTWEGMSVAGLKAWGSERLRSVGILEVEDIVVVWRDGEGV
jgi:hypothetical protein